MGPHLAHTARRLAPALWRCWWLALIAVHVPAFIGVARSAASSPEGGGLLSLTALGLTIGFFALKLADVHWLRFRARRGSMLAFALACVLVHHEAAASVAAGPALEAAPALASMAGLLECIRRVRRHLPQLWSRWLAALHRLHELPPHARIAIACASPALGGFRGLGAPLARCPRAPPA
jgi:hypothetical protein